jgi:hypothetical protein
MNSSDFYFRFNQSTSLQRLEILDRSLSSNDLCRISNIPSHIPVKLLYDNQCSCTVYYLYRHLRHKLLSSILKELTPICYFNMSLNEIEYAENECSFKNKIYDCQQMEGEIQINIPQGICKKDSKPNNNNNNSNRNSSISSFFIFLSIFGCSIFCITCIYGIFSRNSLPKYFHRRQKLPIHSANSYQELNPQESRRKFIVKYNSTTNQTEPHLDPDSVLPNEDDTLKLNIQDNLL